MNLSDRALRALAIHGLTPDSLRDAAPERRRRAHAAAISLDDILEPGSIALVTGPSGSGKSMILRALAQRLRAARRPVIDVGLDLVPARARRRPLIDLMPGTVEAAMSVLARAGLGEARVFALPLLSLSDGQRARALLALAMARAAHAHPAPCTLLADEFASNLDRTTAIALARTVARWARASAARLVLATAHDDLVEYLAPDVLLEQPLDTSPRLLIRRLAA
ncbi:MAG: AAA family ATPase [Phycisphaerales bacterium]